MTSSSEPGGVPPFPNLPSEPTLSNEQPARVCIASYELLGPSQAGGIGAAYSALARALAEAGHNVTLFYLPDAAAAHDGSEAWERRFRAERITLVRLAAPSSGFDVPGCMITSRDAYNWLRRQTFDVIHFPELQGHGYYSVLAKYQGLDFGNTTLCIGTHSPITWIREQNNEPANSPDELEMDFMERRSVALADVVISPSQYMLRWMQSRNWILPRACYVQQNVLDPALRVDARPPRDDSVRMPAEFVFFGKLEERKGVGLFCDALDRLVRSGGARPRIIFLGREGRISGVAASSYIQEHSRNWPFSCRTMNDFGRDAALRFLTEDPNRVAVIPSLEDNLPNTVLECLARRVPFLASAVGGIPELIDARDIADVTFKPDPHALSERLDRAIQHGVHVARPAVDAEQNKRRWIDWHFGLAARLADGTPREAIRPAAGTPPVSVHVRLGEYPELFHQALNSLRSQSCQPAEVMVSETRNNAETDLPSCEAKHEPGLQSKFRVHHTSRGGPDTYIMQSGGEYILFMDAEDYLEKDAIDIFTSVAGLTGADVLTNFLAVFGGTEEPKPEDCLGEYPFLGAAVIPGAFHNRFGSHVAFVRRDLLVRIGPPHEGRLSGWAGWEFLARAAIAGCHFEVIPRSLAWRRVRGNEGLNFRAEYRDQIRAVRPYAKAMPAALEHLPDAALTMSFHYEHFYGLARERLEGDRLRAQAREQLAEARKKRETLLLENEALVLKLIRQMPDRAREHLSSALERWVEYSAVRSQLPPRRVSRVPLIVRQLLKGNYHLFAHGIGSALRDLGKSPKPHQKGAAD